MAPDPNALVAALRSAGIGIPRGLIGDEVAALAEAVAAADAGPAEIERLTDAAAAAHWQEIRRPVDAALRRAAAFASVDADEMFAAAISHADNPDPDNPLARLLAGQAAASLSAARLRAQERLAALDAALDAPGRRGREAAAEAIGAMVIDLLDLDPDDYEPEIVAFVDAGRTDEARRELARATADDEVRIWSRAALGTLDAEPPRAAQAVAAIAAGAPPEDPAEDGVWSSVAQALAEEAISLALVADGDG